MNLHTDIPTRGQIDRLLTNRDPASVSIYVPTDPASSGDAERIELKNLAAGAVRQLEEAGTPKADVSGIDEQLGELDATAPSGASRRGASRCSRHRARS